VLPPAIAGSVGGKDTTATAAAVRRSRLAWFELGGAVCLVGHCARALERDATTMPPRRPAIARTLSAIIPESAAQKDGLSCKIFETNLLETIVCSTTEMVAASPLCVLA
jgi:hypothetical protein